MPTMPHGYTNRVTRDGLVVTKSYRDPGPRPGTPVRHGRWLGWPGILLAALVWAVTVVVAVAVMSLRWHYFTDTLAGAAVGTGTAALLALLIDLPVARRGLDRLCRAWPGRLPAEPHAQPERGRTEA